MSEEDQAIELGAHHCRASSSHHPVQVEALQVAELVGEGRHRRPLLGPAPGHLHELRVLLGVQVDQLLDLPVQVLQRRRPVPVELALVGDGDDESLQIVIREARHGQGGGVLLPVRGDGLDVGEVAQLQAQVGNELLHGLEVRAGHVHVAHRHIDSEEAVQHLGEAEAGHALEASGQVVPTANEVHLLAPLVVLPDRLVVPEATCRSGLLGEGEEHLSPGEVTNPQHSQREEVHGQLHDAQVAPLLADELVPGWGDLTGLDVTSSCQLDLG